MRPGVWGAWARWSYKYDLVSYQDATNQIFTFMQVLISTFLIDHFDLFGLRQTFMGKKYTTPGFKVWSYYKVSEFRV